jgi:GntR family transcriptional repressor for pyruvate dehydrogenase complex
LRIAGRAGIFVENKYKLLYTYAAMVIEKIKKQSVSDSVFSTLRQKIIDGTFQRGDKLPSVNRLSEQFGVSVATIKAALQRLATLGLIETKVGQGSFVLEFNPNHYLDQMSEFFLTKSDISQINEYRLHLEMAATRLAIKKATEDNFKKMKQLLLRMDDAEEKKDIELHGQLDYLFHLEISRATQNNIFVMAYEVNRKLFCQHTTLLNDEYFKDFFSRREKGVEDVHWRIYRAIRNKDIATCLACYKEMLFFLESPPADFE